MTTKSPRNVLTAQLQPSSSFLGVGSRLPDGTIAISNNLVLPSRIFGGWTDFGFQDDAVKMANQRALDGHRDWRRITDVEGKKISEIWNKAVLKVWEEEGRKFAPPEFEQHCWQKDKLRPLFWLATPCDEVLGYVCSGSEDVRHPFGKGFPNPVPVVRSGPARVCE